MNTHTRITNTKFASLDDLLQLQLDAMTANVNQSELPGPPGELDIEPATDASIEIAETV